MTHQDRLKIQLIQMQIHWQDAKANCLQLEKKLLEQQDGSDIILLPEMFNSGFSMRPDKVAEAMDGETMAWMATMAAKLDAVLVGSLAIRQDKGCYNRMIWMPSDGNFIIYDKRHLFAMAGENQRYLAGTERVIVCYRGWRILLQVCYDLRFPVWCRQQGEEYDLMLMVANWPDTRADAWNKLLPARAIENQAFVAAVNRVGEDARELLYAGSSQIIDGMGKTLINLGDKEDVVSCSVSLNELRTLRKALPFLQDRDFFLIKTDAK